MDPDGWKRILLSKQVAESSTGLCTTTANTLRDDIITSVGPLQVCAGQKSGCEAAVHAMTKMYKEEHTEAVILADAANTFNSV